VRRRAAEREAHRSTGEILTLERHGRAYSMWVWPGKIAACMRAGKPYEEPLLEHIREQGFAGTVVDAGANLGNHSVWFAVMCGLRVEAFEPLPHCLEQLHANVARNDLGDRVTVHPVALGADSALAGHAGKGRLHVGSGPIKVRSLDDYHLIDVSVIKIDVEGMEPEVLRGGERTIRRDRPVIFAEEWGQPEHDAIAAVLEPWGYARTKRFRSGGATQMGRWDCTEGVR
jgi:FkbM family methyltransferase